MAPSNKCDGCEKPFTDARRVEGACPYFLTPHAGPNKGRQLFQMNWLCQACYGTGMLSGFGNLPGLRKARMAFDALALANPMNRTGS